MKILDIADMPAKEKAAARPRPSCDRQYQAWCRRIAARHDRRRRRARRGGGMTTVNFTPDGRVHDAFMLSDDFVRFIVA
jgi:hypothetical protein